VRFNLGSEPISRVTWRDPETQLPEDSPTTFTYTQPDGTVVADLAPTHEDVGTYSSVGPATQVGVVRVVAQATGGLQDRQDSVYVVVADFADLPWAPQLAEVGAKVPLRTIERGDVTGVPTGTFTEATLPTDTQTDLLIQGAVEFVLASVGNPVSVERWGLAQEAATLRAAAYVEQAQVPEERDLQLIQMLLDQSGVAITAAGGGTEGTALPVFDFPEQPPWAGGPRDGQDWKADGVLL
jgi:hypothetical protein